MTITWQVQRRPHRGIIIVSCLFAAAFVAFSTILIPLLMDGSWHWYLTGALIGVGLGAMIIHSICAGSICQIDVDGRCSYGFGTKMNLSFALSDVRGWSFVDAGALRGVGVDIDIAAITLLHRKGLNISKMRSYEKAYGCALVLEFLTPDDLKQLQNQTQQPPLDA